MKTSVRVAVILTIGVFAMSSAAIFIRFAQADGIPSLVIAAYRLGIATLALTIPAIRQHAWQDYAKLSWRDGLLLITSGLLLGLHFATWITSLEHTSVASSVVLVTTTPLWIGLLSPLLLGEPTSRLAWVGMLLAMIGGSIIGLSDWTGGETGSLTGNGLALSGAFLVAGYLMIGRSVRAKLRLIPYLWVVYGTAAALLAGWSAVQRLPFTGFPLQTYGWLVALGLIPQLVGHSAANYAVRHISATLVGVTSLGEPIGSTILATLLLDERPTLVQMIGGALILGGIALASVTEERRRPGETQADPPAIPSNHTAS